MDAGYGTNGPLLRRLEDRELTYVASVSSSRVVWIEQDGDSRAEKHRLDDVAMTLNEDAFMPVVLLLERTRTVWVAVFRAGMPKFNERRIFAVQFATAFPKVMSAHRSWLGLVWA